MTRAHIADPHIVRKIEAGEEERIRPCVGATFCMDHRFCIHNPSTGREKTLPHNVPGASAAKRVVVVGGGPAGLEAARVSATRGHEVLLLEAEDRLGGQVALAAKAGWRREIGGVTDWLAAEIGHLGVEARLSIHADRDIVTELDPDVVIVATGGLPDLEWLDGHEHCDSVRDILTGSAPVADHVLIYDELGDHAGASCAEVLADRGADVELAFRGHHAAERSGYCNYPVYLQHFYDKGVTLTPDLRLQKVERDGARLRAVFANELTGKIEARRTDQVVVERGTVPVDDLFDQLQTASCNDGAVDLDRLLAGLPQVTDDPRDGFELYRVGDAVSSRDIHGAILDSRRLCRAL